VRGKNLPKTRNKQLKRKTENKTQMSKTK